MKIRINDPCPCGNDKKYKKCCMKPPENLSFSGINSEEFLNLQLSPKIKDYFVKAQAITQGDFKLSEKNEMPHGMCARFSPGKNRNEMTIEIVTKRYENKLDLFYDLAHEINHGILIYGKGYGYPEFKENISITQEEKALKSILMTMIDDIVVNSTVKQDQLRPYAAIYPQVVQKEMFAIKNGEDPYLLHKSTGISFYNKWKIFRYILAWSFIEYCNLDGKIVSILQEYLNVFQNNFNEEYEECKKIIGIIKDSGIFSSNGHDVICEEVVKLWGLDEKIEIKHVPPNNS